MIRLLSGLKCRADVHHRPVVRKKAFVQRAGVHRLNSTQILFSVPTNVLVLWSGNPSPLAEGRVMDISSSAVKSGGEGISCCVEESRLFIWLVLLDARQPLAIRAGVGRPSKRCDDVKNECRFSSPFMRAAVVETATLIGGLLGRRQRPRADRCCPGVVVIFVRSVQA